MTETADDALATAVASRDAEGVRAALAQGANPDSKLGTVQVLHIAALAGPLEVVNLLIDAGADVNGRGDGKYTPLHLACLGGENKEAGTIVRCLIETGADVNAVGPRGYPLDMAAVRRNRRAAVVLKQAGAKCSEEHAAWVRALPSDSYRAR